MAHTEDGSLLVVFIIAAVVHAVIGLAWIGLWFWIWTIMSPIIAEDALEMVCAKLMRRYRKQMSGLAGLANLALAGVLIYMIFKLGMLHREGDDHKVNWIYFSIGESIAFAMLGIAAGIFYWVESTLNRILLAGMWVLWCILFGLGCLPDVFQQRLVMYVCAVLLQFMSIVFLWIASGGWKSPLMRGRGLFPAIGLVCSLVLYDVYWYIGYLNRAQPGIHDYTRWHAHLVFFFAAIMAHAVVPAYWAYFYTPKKTEAESEHSYAPAAQEAALPAQP